MNNYINQGNIIKKNIKNKNINNKHFFTTIFIYTHNFKGEKIIDYIIKYENIEKFNDLMQKYSIDIKYKRTKKKGPQDKTKIFDKSDMTDKN